MVDEKGKNLEMANALDGMPKALSSENADFLDRILKTLEAGRPLKEKDREKLEALYLRYFGDEKEGDETEKESDDEKPAEDGVDEDDFV